MHKKDLRWGGKNIGEASRALILIHGRGAQAEDILSLAEVLNVSDFALVAPQATNDTWYPHSFLAPPQLNEPWLSSALQMLGDVVGELTAQGIPAENIYFCGFSQGACLTLEFVTRNARRWGGVAAFIGGLIGDRIYLENYQGDFARTPIFIGSSDPDMHVPVARVSASSDLLSAMGADVEQKIYAGAGHTINQDAIERANNWVFAKKISRQ